VSGARAQPLVDVVLPAGQSWTHELRPGELFRIVDLEGNQAVDMLFFNSRDLDERYSATETIRAQASLYLTNGTRLMSSEGRPLLTIVDDTCGRHDTLGGACSAESNQVRYALDKKDMHNCRDSFLLALARYGRGMTKRDLPSNILVLISNCPQLNNPCNAYNPTPVRLLVWRNPG
jgi:urea carboxylase-associated protein 1